MYYNIVFFSSVTGKSFEAVPFPIQEILTVSSKLFQNFSETFSNLRKYSDKFQKDIDLKKAQHLMYFAKKKKKIRNNNFSWGDEQTSVSKDSGSLTR